MNLTEFTGLFILVTLIGLVFFGIFFCAYRLGQNILQYKTSENRQPTKREVKE